jgi:hypothetical protein
MSNKNQKKAWFQGSTENVDKVVSNDPNKLGYPGEVKYDRKPMETQVGGDSRDWEQKWFEGAADKTKKNLGPAGEEFKMKQDWQRIPADEKIANAKLAVGITRKANPAESFWTVYTVDAKGEKTPIVRASLSQIWNKDLNDKNIAKSNDGKYGRAIIAKIKKHGFSKVAFWLTGEEEFAKRAGLVKSNVKTAQAELDMVEEAPAGEMAVVEELPLETNQALDAEVDQTAAESDVTVDLLDQKKAEVESAQTNLVENTAPQSTAEVFIQLQDAEKMLDESKDEMATIAAHLRSKGLTASQKIKLIKLAAEAQNDATAILEGTDDTLSKAQQALEAADAAIEAAAEVAGGEAGAAEEVIEAPGEEMIEEAIEVPTEEPVTAKFDSAKDYVTAFLKSRDTERKKALAAGPDGSEYGVVPDGAPKDGKGEIAAAHPDGGTNLTNVSVGGKPKDEGEKFETVTEAQDKDVAVADKMPTGNLASKATSKAPVKTAAQGGAGETYKEDGSDYWQGLYGQGDAASKEFGKELSKNFTDKDVKAAVSEAQTKVVRAYELAEVASSKGFCDRTAEAKSNLVKEILAFDDSAFVAFKKMLDNAKVREVSASEELVRTASVKIPRLGQKDTAEVDSESSFIGRLSNLGWSR